MLGNEDVSMGNDIAIIIHTNYIEDGKAFG
jgi:hypothetical protein